MATATSGPGDRIAAAPRTERRLSTETKSATKTTEFYAYVAATVGVLLAGLLTKVGDGHDDRLTAQDTWLIVGVLTVGYMISRGLAKSGSREPYTEDRDRHQKVFLFFSNRLGCLGSLLISAVVTIVLLLILGVV